MTHKVVMMIILELSGKSVEVVTVVVGSFPSGSRIKYTGELNKVTGILVFLMMMIKLL